MATSPAFTELLKAADQLSRMAPADWKRFMGAFAAYSTELTTSCLNAPPDHLPAAQGRAQIAAHLTKELENCQAAVAKRNT